MPAMDETTIALLVALAGLAFGSFITMASYRLPREEDIIFKPSRCPACNTSLKILDLFPVLSWLMARGKCRHCGVKISSRYPIIELVTALLFLWVYSRLGITLPGLLLMGMAVILMIMIVADFEHYIIPDEAHIALIPLGILFGYVTGREWEDMLTGFIVGLSIGLALCFGYKFLRKKDGLGFGDVKFLAVVGLWLGLKPLVPFLFFSGVLGVVTAAIWQSLGKGKLFPFGPSLAAALFICVLYPEVPNAFWNISSLVQRL